LFVGRLSEEKGISTLLAAFEGSTYSLEIIGDGPLRYAVELAVSKNENIVYSGYRDKTFIISKLKKCRALIVSSIWYECLPVTILEAFSTGTPVIISNIGNLNEIVTNKYNGLHFKINDPKDLAGVVNEFSANWDIYLPLYQNARTTYEVKYSPAINYENLMSIYSNAIEDFSVNG
jgi:glycosyltransferase involved in cell wall biosynthesis